MSLPLILETKPSVGSFRVSTSSAATLVTSVSLVSAVGSTVSLGSKSTLVRSPSGFSSRSASSRALAILSLEIGSCAAGASALVAGASSRGIDGSVGSTGSLKRSKDQD